MAEHDKSLEELNELADRVQKRLILASDEGSGDKEWPNKGNGHEGNDVDDNDKDSDDEESEASEEEVPDLVEGTRWDLEFKPTLGNGARYEVFTIAWTRVGGGKLPRHYDGPNTFSPDYGRVVYRLTELDTTGSYALERSEEQGHVELVD